ncbi:MAG: NAD(+) diphosphatase, partial [Alloprevotella sp.]|nr:NAD(+) diphosphatase [Alloprevotella sp.]
MERYYWFVFCQDELLLEAGDALPCGSECPVRLEPWHTVHRLPPLESIPCRAVRIDAPVVADGFRMLGLRQSYGVLSSGAYAMAGKAHEILYWDANTKFCGVCGAPMRLHTDISKRCTNCGKEVWPALAPAIIVAIRRADKILLVQSHSFRADYMGLVAGFVETGESLEECVRREVMEETGLTVTNIRYFGSQTWPYPSGLMVGFMADYAGGELKLQRAELRKGGWYDAAHLPRIPERLSIARRMIDSWHAT